MADELRRSFRKAGLQKFRTAFSGCSNLRSLAKSARLPLKFGTMVES
jgi:hypothetical protein